MSLYNPEPALTQAHTELKKCQARLSHAVQTRTNLITPHLALPLAPRSIPH